MGLTRQSGRVARARRQPCLESLETRQLLSHVSASPKPASEAVLNSDGSTNYDQIIGASVARSEFNVDGSGQTVAVIDTGADYNNPALGGGIGAGDKVVAGVDFTGSTNGVMPTWQHGTGVAGIIGGNGGGYTGVAPGADIVALRVFGDNNQGSFSEIADALEWVVQNHSTYNITAVNLSVADGGNYTSNLVANSGVGQQITLDIDHLDGLNIPVVIAAGNSFDGKAQGLGFPAVVPAAISVTATDASDQLASTAQRLGTVQGGPSAVTIAAPGVNITAPSGDNGTTTETGTSFAAPQVAGSIVLLQEMYEAAYHTLPTIAVLDQLLQQGAVTVHDNATGIDVGRLDILNSATILNQQINSLKIASSGGTISTEAGASTGSAAIAAPVALVAPAAPVAPVQDISTVSNSTTASGPVSTTTGPSSSGSTSTGADSTSTGADSSSSGSTSMVSNSTTTGSTSSGSTSTGSDSTSTGSTTTVSSPSDSSTAPANPLTQVFVNGVSIGNYSTTQLAAHYPGLFAFLNGPVPSINIWAAPGTSVDLGPAPATVAGKSVAKHAVATSTKLGTEQAEAIKASKTLAAVHKAALPKKVNAVSTFFSNLFHFKL